MSLTYRGTTISALPIRFRISSGFREPAQVRGSDDVVPGKAGRYVRNRVADQRLIELVGVVQGFGTDDQERAEDWGTNTDTLMALLDMTQDPGALVATGPDPDLGLASGDGFTISARATEIIPGEMVGCAFQFWTVVLEAVGDPPDWAAVS